MRFREQRNSGLGLVEVLIVIATIGFLLVYLSMLNTQPKVRASRINCVSNLKQVGLAMRLFANDHQEKLPWQVPEASGGALERPLNDPTLQFLAISNELTTPKVLLCVDDQDRSRVSNFVGLSRANISYFIGLNASCPNLKVFFQVIETLQEGASVIASSTSKPPLTKRVGEKKFTTTPEVSDLAMAARNR
jgi:hypothetical protein